MSYPVTEQATQTTFFVVLVALMLTSLFYLFNSSVERVELVECLNLKQYSERYDNFYLTEWQKEMCDYREVEIFAPVGTSYEK